MSFLDSSLTLSDYFEQSYLPQLLEDVPAAKAKQFRNAIGRASLLLGHPATLGDLVDPSFAKVFVDHLIERGFTIGRAESFAACLREIRDGARQERKARRKPSQGKQPEYQHARPNVVDQVVQFIADHPRSISKAWQSILEADDQVCASQL